METWPLLLNTELKMKETLEKVSDAILEQPMTITVDVIPQNWYQTKLQQWGITAKQRVYQLRPLTLGTLIRISRILLGINMALPDRDRILEVNYETIDKHGEKLAKIIALAIRNNRQEADKGLIRFILQNFSSKEMFGVLGLVVQQMDLTSFMSSIISIKGMNVLAEKSAGATSANGKEVSL